MSKDSDQGWYRCTIIDPQSGQEIEAVCFSVGHKSGTGWTYQGYAAQVLEVHEEVDQPVSTHKGK